MNLNPYITINCICLSPHPPHPSSPHSPIFLWQYHILSRASCPTLAGAEGLHRVAALLLQVDIFCRTGVLHKLLVELLKCTPAKWGTLGDQEPRARVFRSSWGCWHSLALFSGQLFPKEERTG